MNFLSNMKQKTLLTLLPIVFVLGFGTFAWLANHTVRAGEGRWRSLQQHHR